MLDTRLVDTLSRVFNVDPATLPAWDSVGHINLILELEDVFDIRFASEEIPTLNSAERLQAAISSRR